MEVPLLVHLQKLPPITTLESLAPVFEILWETRKSGLSSLQKSHVQSLLNLSVSLDLIPVLTCLRSIIRKVSKEKLTGEDIQKLIPVDLSTDIQKTLVTLLQKYQKQWEKEVAREQPLTQARTTFPDRTNPPPAYVPLQVSNPTSWPREDNTKSYSNGVNNGCTTPSFSDLNFLHKSPVPALRDIGSSDDPATLPRLKSMTWSMELKNSIPGNRHAIITLKLQDYTKSHLGEVEVKFQLSRDTLEAMLRSMTHINDQLSDTLSEQEDLILWMRTVVLPMFRKLYGRIEMDLKKNDTTTVMLENNYTSIVLVARGSQCFQPQAGLEERMISLVLHTFLLADCAYF